MLSIERTAFLKPRLPKSIEKSTQEVHVTENDMSEQDPPTHKKLISIQAKFLT